MRYRNQGIFFEEEEGWRVKQETETELWKDRPSALVKERASAPSRGENVWDHGDRRDSLWRGGGGRQIPGGLRKMAGDESVGEGEDGLMGAGGGDGGGGGVLQEGSRMAKSGLDAGTTRGYIVPGYRWNGSPGDTRLLHGCLQAQNGILVDPCIEPGNVTTETFRVTLASRTYGKQSRIVCIQLQTGYKKVTKNSNRDVGTAQQECDAAEEGTRVLDTQAITDNGDLNLRPAAVIEEHINGRKMEREETSSGSWLGVVLGYISIAVRSLSYLGW